jgi:hypothetical protein
VSGPVYVGTVNPRARRALLVIGIALAACGTDPVETSPATTAAQAATSQAPGTTDPGPQPAPTATTAGSAATTPESVCDPSCESLNAMLTDRVAQEVAGGTVGWYVAEIGGPVVAAAEVATPFYPASAIKSVHLLHALRWAAANPDEAASVRIPAYADSCVAGGVNDPRSLEQLLTEMMVDSDNRSTNALQDFFGADALANTMSLVGMGDTAIHHKFGCGGPSNDPANTTTAKDLAGLYEAVWMGEVLATGRDGFFGAMIDAPDLIAGAAPPTHLYVKEGWYDTTLTAGGLLEITTGETSRQWVFALFVHEADSIEPDFSILDPLAALWEAGAFGP